MEEENVSLRRLLLIKYLHSKSCAQWSFDISKQLSKTENQKKKKNKREYLC